MHTRFSRTLTCVVLFLIMAGDGMAQQPNVRPKMPSQMDMFIGRPGVVVKRERFTIGTVGDLSVDTVRLTDINVGKSITLAHVHCTTCPDNKEAYLDPVEIDALRLGIDQFLAKVLSATPLPHTEVISMTHSFASFHAEWMMTPTAPPEWNVYLQLIPDDDKSIVHVPVAQLPALSKLLESSKPRQ